ncbi:tripartite motif-containing protein 66 isoform X4 [Tachysurus vachellii]|uniref:tripartite motif-containing protein 66 isoform X4 n=1 Tax=Tachysurus vachellii TaxID=175792 RepID=UPI00296B4604|nr:tripartite motif-containing protein 66 isoform X4 [Tachysurus vachellii]
MEEEREHVSVHKGRTDFPSSLMVKKAESCAVCRTKLSFSSEPKLLPCLHMMCKSCIVKTTEDNNAKECPVCGQSFYLSEVTDCFIFEDSAPKCGGCEESALIGWCQECGEALCSDCVFAHQRVKVTRNHTIIPRESGLSTSLRCTSHKQEQLKFFCVTCDQLTCRDCQLIDHRNHRFLLLEEALVSQKEQLKKLLDSISEQKNSVQSRLQDLDKRLHDIKGLKASSEKQLQKVLRSLYLSLVLRCRQLSTELGGLCDEEEKSLEVMKMSLKKLEDRQEYITAFLQKILSTEGQCILRHKMQIEKCTQRVLSQNKPLPDTMIHLSLSLNQQTCSIIKNFASFKVTRVPLPAKGKNSNGNKPQNTPKDSDKNSSGLISESGATLSVSDIASTQTTSLSVSQAASVLPERGQSDSASSKPVQPTRSLADTMSHASSSSVSNNSTPSSAQSNMTPYVVSQAGKHLPQSVYPQASQLPQVFKSQFCPQPTSLLQSTSSPDQSVLNNISSKRPQQSIVLPKVLLPQSQSGAVLATAAPPGHASRPSIACPSVLVQTSSFQTSQTSSVTNTQSHTLSSNQFVPSLITLSPFAQSSQAISNPHPSTLNSSSNQTQQSILHSQTVSDQSFPSHTAPTNKVLHYSPAVSNTVSENVQPSQSVGTQSNRLQLTLLTVPNVISPLYSGKAWKFYHYTPILTVNNGTILSCAPQPDPGLTTVPGNSNKNPEPPAPSTPPLLAAPIPSMCSNTGLIECGTQTIQIPKRDLPVKAPADSVCDGDASVCSRASPIAKESDSNLHASTVQGKEITSRKALEVHQPQDPLSISSIKDCPNDQSIFTSSELQLKSTSTRSVKENPSTKHWLKGLPSSFREILCSEMKVHPQDVCSRPALEHASIPNAKQDNEKTDANDSEMVEGMDDSKEPISTENSNNRILLVSLLRLPISGSSLSQFRIVPGSQKDEILLQEIDENKSIQRCLRIAAPPAAALPSESCSSKCSLLVDVLDCVVCLSAGASLQCAECGRTFHTSCHVPPIIFNPTAMWVCSLCQDLLDDTDPFRCNRLKEPYLSLPDQRRCEQLLLSLMCENHSYLLYKTIKQPAGCVEFGIIVGRLLGKRSPPYRSAAEMVSDLWALFHNLSSNSTKKDLVMNLQSSFQQRLNVSFGKSIHASLLRPLSNGDHMRAPETEPDREKAKNTLKRMKAFLAANYTPVAKKVRTENT